MTLFLNDTQNKNNFLFEMETGPASSPYVEFHVFSSTCILDTKCFLSKLLQEDYIFETSKRRSIWYFMQKSFMQIDSENIAKLSSSLQVQPNLIIATPTPMIHSF